MDALSMAAVRKDLADLISKVHYRKERMIITRHDKPVAALVPWMTPRCWKNWRTASTSLRPWKP